MNTVRIGIIGIGNMGTGHARCLLREEIPGAVLSAVCDVDATRFEEPEFATIPQFTSHKELLKSGLVDAVLIATPHYDHTTIGIDALKAGVHVLVEKPISVHKADCEKLIAAHTNKKLVFCAMFNQRTDAYYIKIRELIRSGELGEIRRVNWIITNWFRTEIYYASGGWRATWGGEGGGVLLNQCPHNLDLFQWMFGMPSKVRAFCHLGKYHDIEVEDDVTAYCEFPNGATGVFITSTGEAPGTNRLEITAERGRLVYEDDTISYVRNEIPMSEYSRTTDQSFSSPPRWDVRIPARDHGEQHKGILKNFTNAILRGEPLIAPAAEGIHSVELANAMLFSSFQNKTLELPLDGAAYARHLRNLIKNSKPRKKKPVRKAKVDLSKSFA